MKTCLHICHEVLRHSVVVSFPWLYATPYIAHREEREKKRRREEGDTDSKERNRCMRVRRFIRKRKPSHLNLESGRI